MIEPRSDLSPRFERPVFDIPRWKRVLQPVAKRFRNTLRKRYERRVRGAGTLVGSALKCDGRQQLEELLGAPRYSMLGDHYGESDSVDGPITRPDVVEVYETNGCIVEVWFKDGIVMTMCGLAFPTAWEFLSGAAEASEP